MSSKTAARVLLSIALCAGVPLSFAQTPGTPGPVNPKEMGKPGTPANSGVGPSGALNSADSKAARAPTEGASGVKKRLDKVREGRAKPQATKAASAP